MHLDRNLSHHLCFDDVLRADEACDARDGGRVKVALDTAA
jgi:hypothetical protein